MLDSLTGSGNHRDGPVRRFRYLLCQLTLHARVMEVVQDACVLNVYLLALVRSSRSLYEQVLRSLGARPQMCARALRCTQAWCNALSCASSRSMHLINHMHLRAHIIAGAFSAACYLTLSAARYLSPRHTCTALGIATAWIGPGLPLLRTC